MAVINHTIITGQSLAVFNNGASLAGPQTRPTEITYFSGGVRLPLEKANTLADTAAPPGYLFNVRTGAQSGASYTAIKKGTTAYTNNINNLTAGVSTASGAGDSVVARAVHFIHGEADRLEARATYAAWLAEWVADYNADCKAATGQTANLIGLCNQTSQYADSGSGYGQLDAHRAGVAVMVGPIYQLDQDGSLHLSESESYKLGELHGRVHRRVVIDGLPWQPVHPRRIVRTGNRVVIRFHVPAPPLTFDTTLMVARTNSGFSYTDDSSSASVSAVAVTGTDEVTVYLTATPTGANQRIKYGAASYGGNLRDSASDVSALDAQSLPNWCCAFDDPIGYDDATLPAAATAVGRRRRRV